MLSTSIPFALSVSSGSRVRRTVLVDYARSCVSTSPLRCASLRFAPLCTIASHSRPVPTATFPTLCRSISMPQLLPPPGRQRWVDFQQHEFNASQIPPEWHSWLAHIRKDPPSEDPIIKASTPPWKTVRQLFPLHVTQESWLLIWNPCIAVHGEPYGDEGKVHHVFDGGAEGETMGAGSTGEGCGRERGEGEGIGSWYAAIWD